MLVRVLTDIVAVLRPPLQPTDMREAVRIYFGRTIPRAADLEPWLAQFPPPVQRRLRHYVESVAGRVGALLIRDSGAATLDEHLDWMEPKLLRAFPDLDPDTIRKTRSYCHWMNWHG